MYPPFAALVFARFALISGAVGLHRVRQVAVPLALIRGPSCSWLEASDGVAESKASTRSENHRSFRFAPVRKADKLNGQTLVTV